MFDMVAIEVGIGLVFVYLILSLICSAVQETIAGVAGWRSNTLKEGIENLLEDPSIKDLGKEVYRHPLVKKLAKNGKNPSYIPPRNFAIALLDVLKDPTAREGPISEVRDTVRKMSDGPVKIALAGLIDSAQGDLTQACKNVETWFDDSMDRVNGWYKRNVQKWMMGIALVLAVFMNVDSIEISQRLWKDSQLRAQIVAHAGVFVEERKTDDEFKRLRQELNELPVGWGKSTRDSLYKHPELFILKVFGWIFTTIAVSFGAPFWFDGLSKLFNIRAAGRRPEKAPR
jgi:hypothetical protein